ncbi:MAG: hypothetical protein KGP28_03885 [Bdellovibrionales bacterium]|nr:hypothetical protein [Bdellovibrionales bacterium]
MNRVLSFRPTLEILTREYSKSFRSPERIANILAEVIAGLSGYQEEGVKNAPLVFVSHDLPTLLVSIKGNDAIPIGKGPIFASTIKTLLKVCGPIGSGHEWGIFIVVQEDSETLEYGVFRTDRFPLHESSFQRLRTLTEPNAQAGIFGAQKIGENLIEIRDSSGRYHYIDSSGILEMTQNPALTISQWVASVTENAPDSLRRKMESFYHRIAIDLLSITHGTLSAVVPLGRKYPEFLRDGVVLQKDFGLVCAIHRYVKYRDEAATLSLSSYGLLIRKMMSMDGITVFNSSGEVLSYNCFVHEPRINSTGILGGARKRAFEILCSHLGTDLSCVLYRSQDGYGLCRKNDALTPRLHHHREIPRSFLPE